MLYDKFGFVELVDAILSEAPKVRLILGVTPSRAEIGFRIDVLSSYCRLGPFFILLGLIRSDATEC